MQRAHHKKLIGLRPHFWASNMISDYPTHFYKYQPVKDKHAIQNLFNRQAVFSSRLNFNDPFDCKITITDPTPEEAVHLLKGNPLFSNLAVGENFAKECQSLFLKAREGFNKLIDGYTFYCLSSSGKNNLMWSYYADAHEGFCIEFKSSHIAAEIVTYEKSLPCIKLTEFFSTDADRAQLAQNIWKALRIKLEEWHHEDEYRFQLSNSINPIKSLPNGKGKIISYEPDFIESIIFGCRASSDTIDYIKNNMPYKVQYKRAVPLNGIIDITEL